jgi:hypothetical protein
LRESTKMGVEMRLSNILDGSASSSHLSYIVSKK